jgi:hypothetical protein
LNWLFGVSTTDELESVNKRVDRLSTESSAIVHELDTHTSLINETVWELRASVEATEALRRSCVTLDKEIASVERASSNFAREMWWDLQSRDKVDSAFRAVSLAVTWLEDFTLRLGIGMATTASGLLSPSLFPPVQLRSALEEIKSKMPPGWSLTPALQAGEMWKAYEEAKVVAAAVDGGVRLFVHLPVFEFQLAFSVYRVHNIPRAAVNGSIAVLQSDIPDFLAVSTDHQTFMEVAGRDLDQCILPAKTVCPINRAVSKNGAKKSCTAAIFLEDARAVADVCVSSARQWTGQAAVYLGHRRWVFSSPADTSIVLSCPNRKSETVRLPAVGVFEIPMGCTAQSEEWYFQASFRKDLQRQWVSGGVPSL